MVPSKNQVIVTEIFNCVIKRIKLIEKLIQQNKTTNCLLIKVVISIHLNQLKLKMKMEKITFSKRNLVI
jgi:hypothetical protein